MRLELHKFQNAGTSVYELGSNGITLISGSSGCGKTTILQAIDYAITGNGREVINFATPKAQMSVTLILHQLTIKRFKNPVRLHATLEGQATVEDEAAQGLIDQIFADYKSTGYMVTDHDHVLLMGSQMEKIAFLTALTHTVSPQPLITEARTRLKATAADMARAKTTAETLTPTLASISKPAMDLDQAKEALQNAIRRQTLVDMLHPGLPLDPEHAKDLMRRISTYYATGIPDIRTGAQPRGPRWTIAQIEAHAQRQQAHATFAAWWKRSGLHDLVPSEMAVRLLRDRQELEKYLPDYTMLVAQRAVVEKFPGGLAVDLAATKRYDALGAMGMQGTTLQEVDALTGTFATRKRKRDLELGPHRAHCISSEEECTIRKTLDGGQDQIVACPWCEQHISIRGMLVARSELPVQPPISTETRQQQQRRLAALTEYRALVDVKEPARGGQLSMEQLQTVTGYLKQGVQEPVAAGAITAEEQRLLRRVFPADLEGNYLCYARAKSYPLIRGAIPDFVLEPTTSHEPMNLYAVLACETWGELDKVPARTLPERIENNLAILSKIDHLGEAMTVQEAQQLCAAAETYLAREKAQEAHSKACAELTRCTTLVDQHARYLALLLEQEAVCLEAVLDQVNGVLEEVCNVLYSEPMVVAVQCFKELSSGNNETRAQVNLSVHFNGYAYKNLTKLSHGQQSRLALALTIAFSTLSRSPVLLLDETLCRVSDAQRELGFECIKKFLPQKLTLYAGQRETEAFFDHCISL